jgi:para-nitrobenzyl esterase
LRDLPAHQLLDVQTRITPRAAGIGYGPVADGSDIPRDPEAAIADGSAAGIPLLVGTNLEEYKFFRQMDSAVEYLTDETLLARLADPRTTALAGDNATVDPAAAVASTARGARREYGRSGALVRHHDRSPLPGAEHPSSRAPRCAHFGYLHAFLRLEVAGLGWQARRRPRGEHAVRPRHIRCLGQPGPGASRVARRRAADADAGRLDRVRPHWHPQAPALAGWQPYTANRRTTMLFGPTCSPVEAPFESERRIWDARVQAGSVPA